MQEGEVITPAWTNFPTNLLHTLHNFLTDSRYILSMILRLEYITLHWEYTLTMYKSIVLKILHLHFLLPTLIKLKWNDNYIQRCDSIYSGR